MSKLRLVAHGVFPLLYNAEGKMLAQKSTAGLSITGTIQGEGKLTGVPVLFVRTAACNLRCAWYLPHGEISICDTPYSSFDVRDSVYVEVSEVEALILANLGNLNHLVISGGEPFLQAGTLEQLCRLLKRQRPQLHITVETNATLYHEGLVAAVDFFSLSPKLASSVPSVEKMGKGRFRIMDNYAVLHENRRMKLDVIQHFINHARNASKDFQLKFVYSGSADEAEIINVVNRLTQWTPADILLMPLGTSGAQMEQSEKQALEVCLRNGWRYCPRLHIDLFGHKEGV